MKTNIKSKFKVANILDYCEHFIHHSYYGIDFKGGTLIELRSDSNVNIAEIRSFVILKAMNLGDVNVKKFWTI